MGDPISLITAASGLFGIVSGVKSYRDSREAAKEQKKLAALNAANIAAESEENKRRAALDEAYRMGTSTALQAASGVTSAGTMADWERAQREEFQKQMRWLDRSTTGRAGAARQEGSIAAGQTRASGQRALFSGMGGNVKDIYTGGRDLSWWT